MSALYFQFATDYTLPDGTAPVRKWSYSPFDGATKFIPVTDDVTEELLGALQDVADLASECVGVPVDSEAAQYWALMVERATDIARAAIARDEARAEETKK